MHSIARGMWHVLASVLRWLNKHAIHHTSAGTRLTSPAEIKAFRGIHHLIRQQEAAMPLNSSNGTAQAIRNISTLLFYAGTLLRKAGILFK